MRRNSQCARSSSSGMTRIAGLDGLVLGFAGLLRLCHFKGCYEIQSSFIPRWSWWLRRRLVQRVQSLPSSTTWAASSTSPSTRRHTGALSAGKRKPARTTWISRSPTSPSASRFCAAWPETRRQPHYWHRFGQASSIEKIAKEFPKQQFAIIDMVVNQPNVSRWCSRSTKAVSGGRDGGHGQQDRQGRVCGRHGYSADPQVPVRL